MKMSAAEIQSLNFINQGIWQKPEEEQERWYAEHPVEMYESAAALRACDCDAELPGGAA